jgi:hypothetical protein
VKVVVATNSQGTSAGAETGYPFLVADGLAARHDVRVLAMTGFTIRDFNTHVENVVAIEPDLVVLQVGIVECARRILSVREKELIRLLPASRRLTKALHDRRQRVIRARERIGRTTRLYSVDEFRAELRRFRERVVASGADVVLLEIPRFSERYAALHFPFVNEDIDLFNGALRAEGAVPLLDGEAVDDALWQPGTVHLTQAGHRVAAERLMVRIEERRAVA